MSPSALTAPAVARHRAEQIATRTASLADPWITPPPPALVERERLGKAEQLHHPVEHQRLQLGARGRRHPAHPLHAQAGREQLTEDRRIRRVRREVGEEARVLPVDDARQDDALDIGAHRLPASPGRRAAKPAGRPVPRRAAGPGSPGSARPPRRSQRSSRSAGGRRGGTPRASRRRTLRTTRQAMKAKPATTRARTRSWRQPPRASLPHSGRGRALMQSLRF